MDGVWFFLILVIGFIFYITKPFEDTSSDEDEKDYVEKIYDPKENEYYTIGPGSEKD